MEHSPAEIVSTDTTAAEISSSELGCDYATDVTTFPAPSSNTADVTDDHGIHRTEILSSERSLDAPRRSTRPHRLPKHLQAYHCNLLTHTSLPSDPNFPYYFGNYISYHGFSSSHRNYLLNVATEYEPSFYHQAVPFPHWRQAMNNEIYAMERTNTWTIVPLPVGHHAIGSKWVYRVKYKSDGTIDRYKARLVAKGYNQQEGVDYLETFSPVAKIATVKILLTLATTFNWPLA